MIKPGTLVIVSFDIWQLFTLLVWGEVFGFSCDLSPKIENCGDAVFILCTPGLFLEGKNLV